MTTTGNENVVQELLAQAARDYAKAQSPETKAAVRLAQGQAQANGNFAAASAPRSR